MFNNIKSIQINDTDKIILKDYDTVLIKSISNNIYDYFILNKESKNILYSILNIKYSVSKSLYNSDYNLWNELYNLHNKSFEKFYFILDISNNLVLNISDNNSVNCDINYLTLQVKNNINSKIVMEKTDGYSQRIIANMDDENKIYYIFDMDYLNSKYSVYSFRYVNSIFVPLFSSKPSYESSNFYDFINFDLSDDINMYSAVSSISQELTVNDIDLKLIDMVGIIKTSKLIVKMDSGERFTGFVGTADCSVFKDYFDKIQMSYRTVKKMSSIEQNSISISISVEELLKTLTNYCMDKNLNFKVATMCKVYELIGE